MDYVTVDKKVYRADGKDYCSILSDRVERRTICNYALTHRAANHTPNCGAC